VDIAIIVILVTTFLCSLDVKKKDNRGLILSALVVIVFGGLRYGYGSDYPSYLRIFQQLSSFTLSEDLTDIRTEIGWNVLNVLCQPIGFFGMVILLTVFETVVIYRFIGKYVNYKYHWLANICYTLNTELMLLGFSMMRQFLAMCIFLIAIDFIIKRKWIIAVAITMLGGLFHASSFVLIPFCFVGYVNDKTIGKIGIFLLSLFFIFMYFFGGSIIESFIPDLRVLETVNEYVEEYANDGSTSMFSLSRIYGVLVFIFVMIYYRYFNREEKQLSLLYSASILLGGLISIISMAGRINLYFTLVGIVVIPFVIKYLKDKAIRIGFISVYIVFLLYRFNVFFNTPIWSSYVHYHTILEQPWQ